MTQSLWKGFQDYALWIDDHRQPPSPEWRVARSLTDLRLHLRELGVPQRIHLAADQPDTTNATECVAWLEAWCKEKGFEFPRWDVHGVNGETVHLRGRLLGRHPNEYYPDGN